MSSFEDTGSGAAEEMWQVSLPEDGGDGGDAAGEAFAFEHGGDFVGGELVGVAQLDDALGAQGAGVEGGGGLGSARWRVEESAVGIALEG